MIVPKKYAIRRREKLVANAEDLRDEMEDLKVAIRAMRDFHSPDFNEFAYKAISCLARQYIRQIEPYAAPKEKP